MEALIGRLIADFHEMKLPDGVRREIVLPRIQRKANVIIGMRRTGKTYLLFQLMKEREKQGVPRNRLLYLNFEDERLRELDVARMHLITDVYFRRFPENRRHTVYLFFDEIQAVREWERYVRRLLDTEDVEICLTGSSSRLLSRELATSMRGRSLATPLYPFSFRETLAYHGVEPPTDPGGAGKAMRSMLENRLLQYLEVGGFPEVQKLPLFERVQVLQEYANVVILRDVVERHRVENVAVLRHMVNRLLGAPAQLFSVHKLFNEVKSHGFRCAKGTLYEYFDFLQDAFLLLAVPIRAASPRVRMSNPQKMYPIDPGLCGVFRTGDQEQAGYLLESAVCLELRRRGCSLEYVVTDRGHEVDFLATDPGGRRELVQVCLSLSLPSTRERELRALAEAARTVRDTRATVVTLTDEDTAVVAGVPVRIVPAWKWLLG
jgi:hypothetical protein